MKLLHTLLLLFIGLTLSSSLMASSKLSQAIKEKKIYPMGAKIYKAKCNGLDMSHYKTYDKLLEDVKTSKVCGSLSEKHSEALALYVWDVKRVHHKHLEKIKVTKEDKCPVCGMYLYHNPKWIARIKYPKGETYNFDGTKCMFKFYFNNEKGITDILVQDYYTLKTIDARKAYFVVGSDVYGPMGNELIPFSDEKSAKTFSLEHRGKKVLPFNKITEYMVRSLDR